MVLHLVMNRKTVQKALQIWPDVVCQIAFYANLQTISSALVRNTKRTTI